MGSQRPVTRISSTTMSEQATKPPESQTPLLESEAAESSNCSHCLNGKEITINAMDMEAVNVVLSNNRTTIVGDNSQLNICKRCLPRQRVSQSKSGASADGKGESSQIESTKNTRPKRRKRKRSSKVQSTSKCDVDGNSADGENSDSDNADKFKDLLQSDSDD